jgi:hypothetical protein
MEYGKFYIRGRYKKSLLEDDSNYRTSFISGGSAGIINILFHQLHKLFKQQYFMIDDT